MNFQRRCNAPRVALHVWYVIWVDDSGDLKEETFETSFIGLDWILDQIGKPTEFTFEYLGRR